MRKKPVVVFLLLMLLLAIIPGAVLAQEEETTYFSQLEGYVDLYNENLDEIPGIIKRIFANEKINFHIALTEGEEVIGVATSGACEILNFAAGGLETPTLRVYIAGDTIDALMANPSQGAVLEAINNLKIEGVGFLKQVKVTFLNIVKTVSSWFIK